MPKFNVETVATSAALKELQTSWATLSNTAKHPNVFTTFEWFSAWNQQAQKPVAGQWRSPMVLAVKSGDATVAISPLIRRKISKFGVVVRKVEFLESPADYNDLLVGDHQPQQIKMIINHLEESEESWDIVDLRNLRDVTNTLSTLKDLLSGSSLIFRIMPEAVCPYLPIDCSASEMIGRFSRSVRSTLRNQQHRLDRMRPEGLRIRFIEHPETDSTLLENLISLEKLKRIEGKPIPPVFGGAPHVFQSLFSRLGPQGWLYAVLMEMDDRAIAFQLGFRCGDALWDYSKAYDPTFFRLSPGTMLVPAVLDYGFAHGYREYDFLRGEEQYKMRWSTGCHRTWRVVIWNRRCASRLRAFVYLDLKSAVYRTFRS